MRRRRKGRIRVRTENTRPERLLRLALLALGQSYRANPRILGMRPDIVLPRARVAIFVDGCFWHGCPRHFKLPRTNADFWSTKIRSNRQRDRRQTALLEAAGWTVLRFWEHTILRSARAVARKVLKAAGTQPGSSRDPHTAPPGGGARTSTSCTAPTRPVSPRRDRTVAPSVSAAPNVRRKRAAPRSR